MISAAKCRMIDILGSQPVFRLTQILAAVSLAIALIVGIQQIRLNKCVAVWMDENSRINQIRTQASSQDRTAMDELVSAIATSGDRKDPAQAVRDALQRYLKVRAEADRQRQLNPLPDAPSVVC